MSNSFVKGYELIVGIIAATIVAAFLFPIGFDILRGAEMGSDMSGPALALWDIFEVVIVGSVMLSMGWGALQLAGR